MKIGGPSFSVYELLQLLANTSELLPSCSVSFMFNQFGLFWAIHSKNIITKIDSSRFSESPESLGGRAASAAALDREPQLAGNQGLRQVPDPTGASLDSLVAWALWLGWVGFLGFVSWLLLGNGSLILFGEIKGFSSHPQTSLTFCRGVNSNQGLVVVLLFWSGALFCWLLLSVCSCDSGLCSPF